MNIKRIIDISRTISKASTVWPGDPELSIERVCSTELGDVCNLSSLTFSLHTATHIDAPFHFIEDGQTVESLDIAKFIGYVKVFELEESESISFEVIKDLDIQEGDIIFFKTSNSLLPDNGSFFNKFVYINEDAAEYLAKLRVGTIGVDYLSVDKYGSFTYPAHKILLSAKIGIIEGLNLKNVKEGTYFFSCLPLKIKGVDGSPCRAVLLEFE